MYWGRVLGGTMGFGVTDPKPAIDLLPFSSMARYEVRLPQVNRPWRGTRYDSSNLIVDSEVWVYDSIKVIVKVKSESEKWKVSEVISWSLIFIILRYVKWEVLGYNNIGKKKCRTIFLWE